jgi:CRP-like cAMP-binding protein
MASAPDAHPLVRKLESIADLTPEERQALLDLPMKVQAIGADQDIVREGDRPSRCCLLVQGFACRYKITALGKRQIMAFHIRATFPTCKACTLRPWITAWARSRRARSGSSTMRTCAT